MVSNLGDGCEGNDYGGADYTKEGREAYLMYCGTGNCDDRFPIDNDWNFSHDLIVVYYIDPSIDDGYGTDFAAHGFTEPFWIYDSNRGYQYLIQYNWANHIFTPNEDDFIIARLYTDDVGVDGWCDNGITNIEFFDSYQIEVELPIPEELPDGYSLINTTVTFGGIETHSAHDHIGLHNADNVQFYVGKYGTIYYWEDIEMGESGDVYLEFQDLSNFSTPDGSNGVGNLVVIYSADGSYEIISFDSVSDQGNYWDFYITRGAYGTTAMAHTAGETV